MICQPIAGFSSEVNNNIVPLIYNIPLLRIFRQIQRLFFRCRIETDVLQSHQLMPVHFKKFHQLRIGINGIVSPVDNRLCRVVLLPLSYGSTILFIQQIRVHQIRQSFHLIINRAAVTHIGTLNYAIGNIIISREDHRF